MLCSLIYLIHRYSVSSPALSDFPVSFSFSSIFDLQNAVRYFRAISHIVLIHMLCKVKNVTWSCVQRKAKHGDRREVPHRRQIGQYESERLSTGPKAYPWVPPQDIRWMHIPCNSALKTHRDQSQYFRLSSYSYSYITRRSLLYFWQTTSSPAGSAIFDISRNRPHLDSNGCRLSLLPNTSSTQHLTRPLQHLPP